MIGDQLDIYSLLFGLSADEPTSGLDSFQAHRVMQTLKELTEEGKTVVASIHQPRSSIFEMFDDLLVPPPNLFPVWSCTCTSLCL